MMRGTLALSLSMGAVGVRVHRGGTQATIEGVPVLNHREGIEEFVVMFEDGVSEDSIVKFCGGECPTIGHPDDGGVAWASVRGRSALEALLKRRGSVGVAHVEPDEVVSIPDNERNGEESDAGPGIESTPWGVRRVNGDNAPSTGRGVHIYVQDTGIRFSHRDFGGRAIPHIDYTSGSLRECRGDQRCANDVDGHGTHCAGSAGGRVYGIAKEARIYSDKTLGDDGSGFLSWINGGIDFVAQRGQRPAVLSMSLGGPGTSETSRRVLRSAMQAGVIIVVAAGNENDDACRYDPAFSSDVITVGSTDSRNRRSWFSNFGRCVDIMAPGTDITSAGVRSDSATYTMSGTSMACPHVSGGAALILQRNPSMNFAGMRDALTGASNAEVGTITDLRGSADRFLWVGRRRVPGRR